MKKCLLILITCTMFQIKSLAQKHLPVLKVNPGARYISTEGSKPFFWLGDTAWELFHRLTLEEARIFLKNRADKGYNVILAVATAEFGGVSVPNRYGDLAFENDDPAKPNEKYFKHVDQVIAEAEKLGIYIALLPTWGDKFNKKWDLGPEILTPENASGYATFLAKRYLAKNVIWVLGGDRNPETDIHKAIIENMAHAIREVSGHTQLIAYHPQGASYSSLFFHNSDWLDLNMFQSGHDARNKRNYLMVRNDYAKKPARPTLDAEPRYEDHPVNWKPEQGYFNDFDTRQAAWWAFLSGACGHTYGCHDIWQMFDNAVNPPIAFSRTNWQRAMDLPGAFQMGFMKKLAESHPWEKLEPAQEVITNSNPENAGFQIAAMSSDRDFLFVYSPSGLPLTIDLSKLNSKNLIAYWYNPRDGSSVKIGEYKNDSSTAFKPYTAGPETDWILVIDDAAKPWAGFGLKR